MLRAAREKQGLHIAALATMLKVPPRKLEALEADRYDDFQGATFVRALALATCRTLKIDPAPVLAALPEQDSGTLSQLERGLNMPFRERGAGRESVDGPSLSRAIVALVALLLLGALAFVLWPAGWRLPGVGDGASVREPEARPPNAPTVTREFELPAWSAAAQSSFASAPAASASLPATAGAVVPTPAAVTPASAAAVSAPVPAPSSALASASSAAREALRLTARRPSWVEVVDARSQVLLARTLAQGEAVTLDGVLPLRVKIGNAAGTELSFQGRSIDLTAVARDNVARLELK
jgi:cytoskeleton protein RodZ